jgi:hypothetical protein
MPIAFPFFLFAKPAEALRWIRLDTGPPLAGLKPDPRLIEAQRRVAERLPSHLRRDVFRDE